MQTDDLIQSISNAPEFLHLRKEVVELPGRDDPFIPARKILVIEQCGLTNSRQGRIEREVKQDPLMYEFIDPLDKYGAARMYCLMASVSFGDVPSIMEFIAMPPAVTGVWLDKAMQINPDMFAWINEMASHLEKMDVEYLQSIAPGTTAPQTETAHAETLKKKGRTRHKSVNG